MPAIVKDKVAALKKSLEIQSFLHKTIIWWLPLLYFLISSLFYLRTYDSAQVKITIMQMGGLALLTLWLSRLIEAGGAALSREDLVCLSPFLAYLLVGILSFIHAPYRMASVDFFIRHFFFMSVALIVIYEFDAEASERLTKILIWTAWVAVGYGFLQVIDTHFFPPGVGHGIDPFIWRMAFGDRVFSTYGNPNFFADFLVIIFPILLLRYLKQRRMSLIPLMLMLLVDLYFTGTKGAWVGFGIVIVVFCVIAFIYFKEIILPYRKYLIGGAVAVLLPFSYIFTKDFTTRLASVNFRLFTWEATWEMIMTQPFIGTGIGSFPPVYPAFRRPPIFHIEAKHNTETDHAEDEYLEEMFDNGILGFGVFLWLIISTLVVGFKSLGQMLENSSKDKKIPPRVYDLLGYMVAFIGMLCHNFFDVSLRFVSSGVYLGLLPGMIVNLSRGKGLYESHLIQEKNMKPAEDSSESFWKTLSEFLIWPVRLAAWGGLFYIAFLILTQFSVLQGPIDRLTMGGEILQWWLSWGTLLACVFGLGFIFFRLILLSENPFIGALVLSVLPILYTFWGYFKADIHHNIAIYFSKEHDWDKALSEYQTVHRLDPNFAMALYFMGNVFNDRFNMEKTYNPSWGDKNNVPRDDYERALDAYNEVRKLSPNYVQMHYQVGVLHLKRAQWAIDHGHPEDALMYFNRALTRFKLYKTIDPVFGPNFLRIGQVYMMEHRYADAVKAYQEYILADKCAVDPSLIVKPFLRKTILSYQTYVHVPGIPYPVHRHPDPDKHAEGAEVYTSLGNAYFMLNDFEHAKEAYQQALQFDPNFTQAQHNIAAVEQRLKNPKGKPLIQNPSETNSPASGYEIIQKK